MSRSARARVALVVVLGVIAVGGLVAVRLWGNGDYWRVALPGYATGIGTLALAVVTFLLMRQETKDRQALMAAQHAARDEAALAEARKVILSSERRTEGWAEGSLPREVISVVNAGIEPILDVRMIDAETRVSPKQPPDVHWLPSSRYAPFILSGDTEDFYGAWTRVSEVVDESGRQSHSILDAISNAERGNVDITATWTDSRGLHWLRFGRDLPIRLAKPWTWEDGVPLRQHYL